MAYDNTLSVGIKPFHTGCDAKHNTLAVLPLQCALS